MKKKFNVRITEILEKEIPVIASNKQEAIEIIREKYNKEEIILTYEDYTGKADFEIV